MNEQVIEQLEAPEVLSMFVYLSSGSIEEIEHISRAQLGDKEITFFSGEMPIVTYSRSDVFLYSRSLVMPETIS